MFCKTTYCALILMMEMALIYESGEGVDIDYVSKKHTIPSEAFDPVIIKLKESELLTMIDGKWHLRTAPNKITVWQIIKQVAGDNIFTERYYDEEHPAIPTSTMMMIYQERDITLKIIENRLSRMKLSVWSEKASKTVYI